MSTSLLPLVVQIDGGIGRTICTIPALKRLSERFPNRKLIILTGHTSIFENIPFIHRVYKLDNDYLWDDVIKTGEFLYPEPYYNYLYYTQEHHLIQSFNFLLNGEDTLLPSELFLTKEERSWGEQFISERKKELGNKSIAVLQMFGAGGCFVDNDFLDATNRSVHPENVEKLVEGLKNDLAFINASHIPISSPYVWQQDFSIRQLFSIIKACDMLLTIDSLSSHVGAVWGKPGVLLLGGTFQENVGYTHYTTIQRSEYPRLYFPNRFGGKFELQDNRTMQFTDTEIDNIIAAVLSVKNNITIQV